MMGKHVIQAFMQPKYRQRLGAIISNSLNGLLLPFLNSLIALLVIRLGSATLWGKFVNLMIIAQLGSTIVAWGNKEYLLRAFSRSPAQIASTWYGVLVARSFILIGLLLFLPIWINSPEQWAYTALWMVGMVWYQSFDVFVQYKKDFAFVFIIELIVLGSLFLLMYFIGNNLSTEILLLLFAGSYLFKSGIFTFRYQEYTLVKASVRPNFTFFSMALPFFLLGFSGMLQSRVDIYSVSFYFGDTEVGKYQVFINLIIYLQALANFILVPFVKNLYRLDYASIQKVSNRLFAFGSIILIPGLAAIYFVMKYIYVLEFPLSFFVAGGLYALPSFYFLPIIYAMYKVERQNIVLILNFSGAIVILGLNFLLLPRIGLLGAMVSVAAVHWGLFAFYVWQLSSLR